MKKKVVATLTALLLLTTFSGCSLKSAIREALQLDGKPIPLQTAAEHTNKPKNSALPTATPAPENTPEQPTEEPTPEPTLEPTPEPTSVPVETPAPTGLSGNRQDLSMEEIIEYFRQVVFGTDTNAKLLKWVDPIVVSVTGKRAQPDDDLLVGIFDQMNSYEGFPGITYLEAAGADANVSLEVRFVTEAEMKAADTGWNGQNSCYVHYSNDKDKYQLYHATIYLVSEWVPDQAERDYLLTWAAFYAMGFFNDSGMYVDSIFSNYYFNGYSGGFDKPTTADWYLFSALYYKQVKPGMTYQQAVDALNK